MAPGARPPFSGRQVGLHFATDFALTELDADELMVLEVFVLDVLVMAEDVAAPPAGLGAPFGAPFAGLERGEEVGTVAGGVGTPAGIVAGTGEGTSCGREGIAESPDPATLAVGDGAPGTVAATTVGLGDGAVAMMNFR